MNWLYIGLPLAGFYLIWFGVLVYRRNYTRKSLWFGIAHIPYLLLNLVAPFRGVLDPDYAGYQIGWIKLPPGIWVTIVVGFIVAGSFLIATKAISGKMKGLWKFAMVFDFLLVIFIAIPILIELVADMDGSTIELGEYLTISGWMVALIVLALFSGPTIMAAYYAARKSLTTSQ